MNPDLRLGLALAAAGFAGAGLAWLALRARWLAADARADASASALAAEQARAAALAESLRVEERRNDELAAEIRQADVARAGAQEHAARIPELREEISLRDADLRESRERLGAASARLAALESTLREERRSAQEKQALLADAQVRLADAFNALSADALRRNNESFLELARAAFDKLREASRGDLDRRAEAIGGLLAPVREAFDRFEQRVQSLESVRAGAYESLTQQVGALRGEAARLAQALGAPKSRGRWGELQLRRVLELAGMQERCDFVEQPTASGDGDARQRPDVVVRLPGDRSLVVDAKAPMSAYIEAVESEDAAHREDRLREHARRIREHARLLGQKAYWEAFQPAPEFVVLFLPGEAFFSAAVQADPELIDWAAERRVILAAPTTLIALLKAVAHAWRQETLHAHAREIAALARQFRAGLEGVQEHVVDLGRRLDQALSAYHHTARHLGETAGRTAAELERLGVG